MNSQDFIIIGAGQAGLCMAYYLKQQGYDCLLLDANSEVGAPWLQRWDSLKLFTPTEFNHLPGMDFPYPKGFYPNKYHVADYLKAYAKKFQFNIQLNQKITSVKKQNEWFILNSSTHEFKTHHLIIATGPFHTPYTPPCHQNICNSIHQIHSEYYKNPEQLQPGDTLVVGSGDSGVQILQDILDGQRKVYFSGDTKLSTIPQEIFGKTLWWWFQHVGFLSIHKYSWLGKKISKGLQPIIGTDVKSLFNHPNVECVGRTLHAKEKEITFEKKIVHSIKNIIWATGFKPNFHWIDNIQLDESGYPKNYRGVSSHIKNLYFIGLPWLYTRGSATLGGVKKDAEYLINAIVK